MTRTMYDSTTAGDCPANGDLYLGYVDGRWADFGDMVRLFPGKQHVRISVSAFGPPAEELDVEAGDATPDQAPGWVNRQHANGIPLPAVYCNRGNEDAVAAALQGAGVPTTGVVLHLATGGDAYTGPWEVRGYRIVAVQDRTSVQTGGHYDASTVYADDWMPTTAAPLPQFQPQTLGDLDMATVKQQAITIGTDGNGNGWDNQFEQRGIPWSGLIGAPFLNGTDPDQAADRDYAHGASPCAGSVRAQQRDGKVLLEVMGCRPNASEVVWLTWLE